LFIQKYRKFLRSEFFTTYAKALSEKIVSALCDSFSKEEREPKAVNVVSEIINRLEPFDDSALGYKIRTRSAFIHGVSSRVEFNYYGKQVRRELGDLIFVVSFIYQNEKFLERVTISQVKKELRNTRLKWNLDSEQLFLLSRWPSFKSSKGSFWAQKEYFLSDLSGSLGSFLLLFRPGDFMLIAAPDLERIIGGKKSVSVVDINRYFKSADIPLQYYDYFHDFCLIRFFRLPSIQIISSSKYAANVFAFIDRYLSGSIGEPVYSIYQGEINVTAQAFLHEVFSVIKKKGERDNIMGLITLGEEFFKYKYHDRKDEEKEGRENNYDHKIGGFGLIYTSINLGE